MSIFFAPCLFFLSFSPLWLAVIFLDVMSVADGGEHLWTEYISLFLIALGVIISVIVMLLQFRERKGRSGTGHKLLAATKQRAATAEYFLFYVLPLFAFDFTLWRQVVLLLIFFVVIAFLCLRNRQIYANVILECMGYSRFECTFEYPPKCTKRVKDNAIILSKQNLAAAINSERRLIELGGGYWLDITEPSASR